jgi:hypothetical protein
VAAILAYGVAASAHSPASKPVPSSPAPKGGASSPRPATELPPGHPDPTGAAIPAGPLPDSPAEGDDEEDLPPGHPTMGTTGKETQEHAAAAASGIFEPPPDTESEDAKLPKGSIEVELRNAANEPLPQTDVTIGILHQSVAKGESREHKVVTTDDRGLARLEDLETGSGVAYRVTVVRDGATFAALPFQLPATRGEHVVLHVYGVTHDIQDTLIVMQGVLFVEVKDDRVQIEQLLSIFNLGKLAWLPEDVFVKLPHEFSALSAQPSMSDQGLESVDRVGGRLKGTFPPGRHEIQFRWQLPYSGTTHIEFEEVLPPHVAAMRVMAGGMRGVQLLVQDFPEAQAKTDAQGARLLITEKQAGRGTPIDAVHVKIEGLPSAGSGNIIATCLAGSGVALGLGLGFIWTPTPRRTKRLRGKRSRLLAELLELEEAKARGDIGPVTYEKTRRHLVDLVAQTIDEADDEPRAS